MPHGSRNPKIALWIFVTGCLLSSARLIVETPGTQDPADTAQQFDQRFAAVRSALPKRGVIGYIGQTENGLPQYYLAQFALAPLVVDHSPNHSIVIGNFSASLPKDVPGNLELVRDFGSGVFLFVNKDAQ
ncbi:MAG TPA: hypothetical protein VJQ54_13870 [Candidatus Sulfotelmatobacter sp.]|nr:hypothetical protein [Candidatus Sulfotelmatobacter sp.]